MGLVLVLLPVAVDVALIFAMIQVGRSRIGMVLVALAWVLMNLVVPTIFVIRNMPDQLPWLGLLLLLYRAGEWAGGLFQVFAAVWEVSGQKK